MKRIMRTMLSVSLLVAATLSVTTAADDVGADRVRAAIAAIDPQLRVEQIEPSPVAGLYRVRIDGVDGYVTADGRHLVSGDLFDVASRENLTERGRERARRAMLQEAGARDAIVFAPKQSRHTITVFTDVDCGYCRKLHKDIAAYNERGIAVRYLAFPRMGPGSEAWKKMEAVWCAKDRGDALTRAKRDEPVVATPGCATGQVAADYALGQRMHVQGTPMIVLEDGRSIGGYLPPQQLLERIEAM